MDKNITDLQNLTNDFYNLHCSNLKDSIESLEWKLWNLIGEMAYNENQGVYAILENKNIIYIGSAISYMKDGIYKNNGLGRRINSYTRWNKSIPASKKNRHYYFNEFWSSKNASVIATLGFPKNYSYLAIALEHYLIEKLKPKYNIISKNK